MKLIYLIIFLLLDSATLTSLSFNLGDQTIQQELSNPLISTHIDSLNHLIPNINLITNNDSLFRQLRIKRKGRIVEHASKFHFTITVDSLVKEVTQSSISGLKDVYRKGDTLAKLMPVGTLIEKQLGVDLVVFTIGKSRAIVAFSRSDTANDVFYRFSDLKKIFSRIVNDQMKGDKLSNSFEVELYCFKKTKLLFIDSVRMYPFD